MQLMKFNDLKKIFFQVINYSVTKGLELVISMLIILHVSMHVSPEELSILSAILLFVTYSSFANLGINSALLKFTSKYCRHTQRFQKQHSLATIFQASIILGVSIFSQEQSLGFLLSFHFIRQAILAKLRVDGNIRMLSSYNAFYVLNFSILYYLLILKTDYISALKISWIFASLTVIIPYSISHLSDFKCEEKLFDLYPLKLLFKYGPGLMVFNLGLTISLSLHKLLLNFVLDDKNIIGLYQFADQLSSIPYIASLTVSFIAIKPLITLLSKGKLSIASLLSYSLIFLAIVSIFTIFFYHASILLIENYTQKYLLSIAILPGLLFHKLILIMNVPMSAISMAFNLESKLNKILFYLIVPSGVLQLLTLKYIDDSQLYIPYISSFFTVVSFGIFVKYALSLERR